MTVANVLLARNAAAVHSAKETWRKLVSKVADGGELSAKELDTLESAADVLDIDPIVTFTADVEALQRLQATESQIVLLWPTGSDKRLADALAELERVEKEVLPAARRRAGELRSAHRVASETRSELVRLREANPRLFN